MAAKTVTFTSMPSLPTSGVSPDELKLLSATRDNINLLIGATEPAGAAIIRGSITVSKITATNFKGMTAKPGGFNVSGALLAGAVEVTNLMKDVQNLAFDIQVLRETLNALIAQLKVQ